jgi:hypothetical protein
MLNKTHVQQLILWLMVVQRTLALSIVLRFDSHRQQATKTAP